MKTDLLNAHGLCGQCSITQYEKEKFTQKGYKNGDFFTFYNNLSRN